MSSQGKVCTVVADRCITYLVCAVFENLPTVTQILFYVLLINIAMKKIDDFLLEKM